MASHRLSMTDTDAVSEPIPGSQCVRLRRIFAEYALHDWLVFVFLTILSAVSLTATRSPTQLRASCLLVALTLFQIVTVVSVRSGWLRQPWAGPILYRLAIVAPIQASYFVLGSLLPIVSPHNLDASLHALDLRIFGLEPSVALIPFVNSFTSEWFAFFYFCYFFALALHVIPILFFSRRPRILSEFAFGFIVCFGLGHLLYILVPGFGPYRALSDLFPSKFPSGQWIDMVMTTVASGGAQKDIFPSLHTAAPTFLAIFSYRNRHLMPFRYTWGILYFFAMNIVVATMFLRWHYIIDIVAGLALATLAAELSMRLTDRELQRRAKGGLTPLWPALPSRRSHGA